VVQKILAAVDFAHGGFEVKLGMEVFSQRLNIMVADGG
jgi:hypothetical protein